MVSASIPVPMHRCQCNSIWGRKLKVFTSQLSSFSNTSICSTTWLLACSSAKNVGLLKMVVPSPLVSAPTQKNWRYKLLYCEVSICSSQHPTEYVREGVGGGVQIIWGFHVAPKGGWIYFPREYWWTLASPPKSLKVPSPLSWLSDAWGLADHWRNFPSFFRVLSWDTLHYLLEAGSPLHYRRKLNSFSFNYTVIAPYSSVHIGIY